MTPPLHRRTLLRTLSTTLGAAVVIGLTGCAGLPSQQASSQALLQRATDYWALVQQNDKLKAWAFEATSKDPNANFEGYAKRGGITFHAIQVQGIKSLENGKALVTVQQRYSLPLVRLNNQESTLQDHWHLIDGQWYHVVPPSVAFPSTLPRNDK